MFSKETYIARRAALKDKVKRLYGSFLMGETDCGGNWVLF